MTPTWKQELRIWANQTVEDFGKKAGVLGVIMGGSLARGQEWRHSDMEIGLLVEAKLDALPYFHVIGGRGVEAIQLVRGDLEKQVLIVESGDLSPILHWPIQLWLGRVISDPTGLLGRYKKSFDDGLFQKAVVEKKILALRTEIDRTLGEARGLLAENRPAAALVKTRSAMNEAILAQHWALNALPRSQNRTDSRLRLLCRKHGTMGFYDLYRDVFALSGTRTAIRRAWPVVRDQVLEITRLWGDSTRDFFRDAVDSHFKWRQNAGILTVYRLYIPIIGGENSLFTRLDEPGWSGENPELVRFLGLDGTTPEHVARLVDRLSEACAGFGY